MLDQQLSFQVGDQVIHWNYGPGVILRLDVKELSGNSCQYYVVKMNDLMLWVPVSEDNSGCLRLPTPAKDFQQLFRILTSPGEPLPSDRYERKTFLTERFKERNLASICRVIRDLTIYKRTKKLNDNDVTILDRSKNFLINEWSIALSVSIQQAQQELDEMISEVNLSH